MRLAAAGVLSLVAAIVVFLGGRDQFTAATFVLLIALALFAWVLFEPTNRPVMDALLIAVVYGTLPALALALGTWAYSRYGGPLAPEEGQFSHFIGPFAGALALFILMGLVAAVLARWRQQERYGEESETRLARWRRRLGAKRER